MSVTSAVLMVVGLVVVAIVAGQLLRLRDGRVRAVGDDRHLLSSDDLGLPGFDPGVTLLQFSTRLCSRCPGVRRLLQGIAAEHDEVAYADIDLTDRPELARRLGILQTPTTYVVDVGGAVRAVIAGVPARADVVAEIEKARGSGRRERIA